MLLSPLPREPAARGAQPPGAPARTAGAHSARSRWGAPPKLLGGSGTISVDGEVGKQQKTRSQTPPKQSLLTIALHPPCHVVCLASNKRDADYNLLGDHRRDYLYEVGQLNPGAVHIRVSARTDDILVFAKSASSSSGGWTRVGTLPSLSGSTPTMMDYYRVLHELSSRFPKSVVEGAFYGHAWHGGPIVWNTADENLLSAERHPDDADARCKNWLPDGVIATTYPELKSAFAADGRFFVAGCSHMPNVYKDADAALKQAKLGTPPDEMYEAPLNEGWLMTWPTDAWPFRCQRRLNPRAN